MHHAALIIVLAGMVPFFSCRNQETNVVSEQTPQTVETEEKEGFAEATFAGGCFWGVEYNFRKIPGVAATAVGFMGGKTKNPSYKDVCYTDTNHAEVVHLRYDPEKVSYQQLVKIFFVMHDPTTLNRQGPDVGDQYRSAVFYYTPEQKEIAEKVKKELNASGKFRRPIVTEITPASEFWKAEEYHQRYIEKNPWRSCHVVDPDEIKKILKEG